MEKQKQRIFSTFSICKSFTLFALRERKEEKYPCLVVDKDTLIHMLFMRVKRTPFIDRCMTLYSKELDDDDTYMPLLDQTLHRLLQDYP